MGSWSIIDTTLRDGEQRSGIALGVVEKIAIAKLLAKLPIQQLEIGIPAMGGAELEAIEAIVSLELQCELVVWNRLKHQDIKKSLDCAADIIHLSVPSSQLMLEKKLNRSADWILKELAYCIEMVVAQGKQVSVGLEDATRAQPLFLLLLGQVAQEAGAQRLRLADTVGLGTPEQITKLVSELCTELAIPIGFHGHNDLGLAVANTLAALQAGASYVDCTIGGVGERAGNCNLLQLLHTCYGVGLTSPINLTQFREREAEILTIYFSDSISGSK